MQARRDDAPGDVADLGGLLAEIGTDRRDQPAGKSHVIHGVEPLLGIDDPTALQDQVKHGLPSVMGWVCGRYSRMPTFLV